MTSFFDLKKGDKFYARKVDTPDDVYGVSTLEVEEIHIEERTGSCIHYDYDVDWGCTGSSVVGYKYQIGYIVASHYFCEDHEGMNYKSYLIIPLLKEHRYATRLVWYIPSGEQYVFSTSNKNFVNMYKEAIEKKERAMSFLQSEINEMKAKLPKKEDGDE